MNFSYFKNGGAFLKKLLILRLKVGMKTQFLLKICLPPTLGIQQKFFFHIGNCELPMTAFVMRASFFLLLLVCENDHCLMHNVTFNFRLVLS